MSRICHIGIVGDLPTARLYVSVLESKRMTLPGYKTSDRFNYVWVREMKIKVTLFAIDFAEYAAKSHRNLDGVVFLANTISKHKRCAISNFPAVNKPSEIVEYDADIYNGWMVPCYEVGLDSIWDPIIDIIRNVYSA